MQASSGKQNGKTCLLPVLGEDVRFFSLSGRQIRALAEKKKKKTTDDGQERHFDSQGRLTQRCTPGNRYRLQVNGTLLSVEGVLLWWWGRWARLAVR
jgi:hypothetical protein